MPEPLLHVGEERVHLPRAPVGPDGRHQVLTLAHDLVEALAVLDDRARRDVGPDRSLPEGAVALRADAGELLGAEIGRPLGLRARLARQPAVELTGGNSLDGRAHGLVLDPAELGALA